jgi:electron transfer flavoprotein alpha subunit
MTNVVAVLFGEGGVDRSALGTLGAGQKLASQSGGSLIAVVLGPLAGGFDNLSGVVDRVIVADQPELEKYQPDVVLSALQEICSGLDTSAVLLGSELQAQELAPRLAHRLGGSSLADAIDVQIIDGAVRATRSAYGGKATSVYELKRRPAVVWVRSRAMEPGEADGRSTEAESASVRIAEGGVRIVERKAEEHAGVRLEDAQLIVSGGRGLGGPEPFEELQKLANSIGAEMGASRAACDSGWVPPTWQVGQTGKKVAPELYLAIAISGASQHLLGMGDSRIIAAINTDPDAPIFKHCSFGIVEDYKNVVPLLTEKLAALIG